MIEILLPLLFFSVDRDAACARSFNEVLDRHVTAIEQRCWTLLHDQNTLLPADEL